MKKILSALLVVVLMANTPYITYASENQEIHSESSSNCTVTANIPEENNFSVIIPKSLTLDSTTYSTEYKVKVSGSISYDKIVNVIPDTNFILSSDSHNASVSVSQDKTAWSHTELDGSIPASGAIQAENLSAGTYSGSFCFHISLEEASLEAGLYGSTGLLYSWNDLTDTGWNIEDDWTTVGEPPALLSDAMQNVDSSPLDTYIDEMNLSMPDEDATSEELLNFYQALNLKLVIDDSVTRIGERQLYGSYISNVIIPTSVTYLARFSLAAPILSQIILPDSIETIQTHAFALTNIKELRIPNSVTELCTGVFGMCLSLEKVIIPTSINQMDSICATDYAFDYVLSELCYEGSEDQWNQIDISENWTKVYSTSYISPTIIYNYSE